MKEKWEFPTINVEKFVENDAIAACYEVYCYFPNSNSQGSIYLDSNENSQLDRGDKCVLSGKWSGDGVSEFTRTYPENNGFWVSSDTNRYGEHTVKPVFVYQGAKLADTPDITHSGWHAADLSNSLNSNAIKDVSTAQHPNHS